MQPGFVFDYAVAGGGKSRMGDGNREIGIVSPIAPKGRTVL